VGRQTPAEVTRLAAGGEPLDAAVAAFLTERDLAPSSHRVYVFTLRGGHRGRRRAGPVGPVAVAVADEGEHRLQLRPGRASARRAVGERPVQRHPVQLPVGVLVQTACVSIAARSPRLI
jgi:hypothetical protein